MSPDSTAAARSEIDERRAAWIAAIEASDPDAFVAVLADDAVWLPSGGIALEGRSAIREWLVAPMAEYDYEYAVRDVRVRVAEDWAVERARFETRAVDRAGERPPIHEGTYTIVWRRTAAGWVIDRYLDHSA